MYELSIILFLSIIFTFSAFVLSNLMMKVFKINHPKNRFWIYSIAMITAFSVFSFSFIVVAGTSNTNSQVVDYLLDTEEEYCSSLMTIEEETNLKNDNFSSIDEVIISSVTTACTTHNRDDYCCFDSMNYEFSEEDMTVACCSGTTNFYHYPPCGPLVTFSAFPPSFSHIPHQIISEYWISSSSVATNSAVPQEESLAILGTIPNMNDNSESTISDYVSIFLIFNLLLIILSTIYLIFSFVFGKKYTLKSLNAKNCQDPEILHMIKELSKGLKIKTPKIFVFNGPPNAFVFGYPISLAISKELINCLSKEELRMTMYHELAHIKNRDVLIKPLLQAIRILFFYNPVIHVLYNKMIKERELMADTLYINSKAEKVTFMEALIKIHDYTKHRRHLPQAIYGSYSLSLVCRNPKKLKIKDRFNRLFGGSVKKSFYSIFICLVILSTNISLIAVAQNVLPTSTVVSEEQETSIVEIDPEPCCYEHQIEYISILYKDHSCPSEIYIIFMFMYPERCIQKGDGFL